MNAKEYLKYKLNEISAKIANIHLKYAYDSTTNFHIIEVSPKSIREENEEYASLECEIWAEFYAQFPEEDIVISEPHSFHKMENILFDNLFTEILIDCVELPVSAYQYRGGSLKDNYYSNTEKYLLAAQ